MLGVVHNFLTYAATDPHSINFDGKGERTGVMGETEKMGYTKEGTYFIETRVTF